jgi:4-aminobutyrate aminotransferase-like enzyme
LVSGFAVKVWGITSSKEVIEAIKIQLDKYLHLTVYGGIYKPLRFVCSKKLNEVLPAHLSSVYFTNSGVKSTTEGALKLAKNTPIDLSIVAFHHSYHGGTHGA